jgi:hypothetical protein
LRGQPIHEAVTILALHPLVVMVETNRGPEMSNLIKARQ